MSSKLARIALAAAVAMAVVGCNKEQNAAAPQPAAVAPAPATPEAAIMASVKHLKAGNIDALIQNALPAGEYAKLKADWAKEMNKEPITDEDRAKFTEQMGKLTGPDAEKQMWAGQIGRAHV